jgi:quercetin dioxygenase-like cupin family protein
VVSDGGEMTLHPGDSVFVPAGTSTSFRNAGQSEASLLAVMIFPDDPFGSFAQTSIDDVAVELLAGGMVDSLPSRATISLLQATFAPGTALPPSPAEGPGLGVLTAGNLTYTVSAGESAISHGARSVGRGRPAAEPAALNVDIPLTSGDAFIEETGSVSGVGNTGDADAALLVVFLAPLEPVSGMSTPAAATTPVG